ncbi:MAG: hypothetical protein J0J10_26240 [Bosea sp.]|uniref:hypothetical protein n=1 Tax=Bosea sp. (in: a-proteobacteria) TaxID=1871050 RepID=UPI001AC4F0EF|nr:hypothetical protein [Bosea sp. (in: a-proteobacteria)]MBN9472266.1 hypothetical protein [Bosea sp. (in: a-proteobacteria)]
MGFSPQQVGEMSLWQFMACADGWARANSPDAAKITNDDDEAGVRALYDAAPMYLH